MSDSIEEQIERAVRADVARRDTGLEEALCRCETAGEAVFLFGADRSAVRALQNQIGSAWPQLRLAGICDAASSGPTDPAVLAHIATCAPDVVIVDVAPKRHRALIAEFAAHGLHTGLINLPGTFARYVATHPAVVSARPDSAPRPARLSLSVGNVLNGLAGIMRFSGIVARQLVQGAATSHAAQAYTAVRRDG